jgi:hypothetical protein
MIVRPGDGVLHLITQPDHAALARRLMEHCVPLAVAPRRGSILLAVGEHDNGWRDLDEQPSIDSSGRIVDFISMTTTPKQAVWPRAVERLGVDPMAAALVAHHAVTVYDRFRPEPEWTTFFAQMEAMRDRLLPSAGLSIEELRRDYAYVRVGDLISLTFCTAWTEEQKYDDWRVGREDDRRVVVSPKRFDRPEIPFEVNAVELPDRSFESDRDFRDTLAKGRQVTLSGTIATHD